MDTIEKIRKEIESFSKDKFIFRGENKVNPKISSTLYREQEESIENILKPKIKEFEKLNFPAIEKEIIDKAKRHFRSGATDGEILIELQHYGGKTPLIDFSKNFLIALFFACNGEHKGDGRLICYDTSNLKEINASATDNSTQMLSLKEKDYLLIPDNNKNSRVIFQSSVFIRSSKGFIEVNPEQIITIKEEHKQKLLEELRKYYNIHMDTIYNDLQGFITNSDNYKTSETWFYMGLSYGKDKKYEEAIKAYSKALTLNPNLAGAYNNRGVAKARLGYYKEAKSDYDDAIRLKPDYALAYNNRGVAKEGLGDYKEAKSDYDDVIRLKPDYALAYNNRGVAKEGLGDYKGAISDYNEAIRLNPNLAEAYDSRGLAKEGLGDYKGAISDYNEAIRLNPNLAEAYNNREEAKRKLGES